MKILVKFPSRSRPAQFLRVLKGWIALSDDVRNLHFLFSFDADDVSMYEAGNEIDTLGIDATIVFRTSKSKVHAINRDIEDVQAPWDIVLVISDDMECVLKGWDAFIIDAFAKHYPDGDGSLWLPDGKQKDICTIPCVGRKYYQRTNEVYDSRFVSVFCDDLHTHQAKALGRLTFIDVQLASHRHPANFSDVKPDDLHKRNETQAIWDRDQDLFKSIMAKGLPI